MKVAIVYDRINKFGGAERVLLSLHRIFPEAPIYTLVHEPKTSQWAKDITVIPTFLNKFSFLRRRHEWLSPIAPLAFETLNLSEYDVVISVTSGDAKSVITRPHQLHVCYCLTPTRYFWSGEAEYAGDKKFKLIPGFLKDYFKSVDLLTSTRPDYYISISEEVNKRVKKFYNRDSSIIYPPIEDKFYSNNLISHDNREYYLVIGRLVPYKKFDLAIAAFNKLKLPLVVIGAGSEYEKLRQMASPNISFVGAVDDHRLIEYYRHAKAVIFPQEEDFGLVPIEAQASGTPVIAFGKGGALETVIHKKTGYLFPEQTIDSLANAVKEFRKLVFKPKLCVDNSNIFNYSSFEKQFSDEVKRLWKNHQEV
jgi:glycosyltransferase involved in cell wall biosynthesis